MKNGGVTQVWDTQAQLGQGVFEQGYTQGLAAGALNIVAPTLAWNGELIAGSAGNTYQRTAETMAFGGSFSVDTSVFNSTQGVLFQTEKNIVDIGVDDKFPTNKQNQSADLVLSTALTNDSGLQKLSIKTLSDVKVAADADIVMKSGSRFSLDAGHIDVQGDIYSAGGAISLTSRNTGIVDNSGKLDVGSGSVLDVSGRWVNDYALGLEVTPVEPLAIAGGSVKLTASGDLKLASGSAIRADGGAWLAQDNRLSEGKGGAISLETLPRGDNESSLLHLDGKLSAYGLSEGGSLSLASGDIIVGAADNAEQAASALVLGVHNGQFDFAKDSGLVLLI